MTAWIAGFNQPGYLPDSEPEEFDTFAEAAEWLEDEINRALDDSDLPDADIVIFEQTFSEAVADEEPFSLINPADRYAYWIVKRE